MTAQALTLISLLFVSGLAFGTPSIQGAFLLKYPDAAKTQVGTCATCHMPAKDGFLNSYGTDLQKNKFDFVALEVMDSDKDGKLNLDEILAGTNPGSQADEEELFVFPAKFGTKPAPVTFDHGKHVIEAKHGINGDCLKCHHQDPLKPEDFKFFKVFDKSVVVQEQAHETCIGCHKATVAANAQSTAPTKCADCHNK